MAKQLHASLTKPNTMSSVEWRGVKHYITGLWSSGNLFCGVTNHASLIGSLMGESGIGGCRENECEIPVGVIVRCPNNYVHIVYLQLVIDVSFADCALF